ncbi:hypothetical protein PG995_006459 [Apiospora arundinis]
MTTSGGGLGHDGTTNDDAAQARSLSSARSRSQSLGGVSQVNGSVLVQDDLEDSIPPAASLPLEHYGWSHPDPAISMSIEEDISQVAEAEILGTTCRKRKARQADESRPCKRARGRPAGSTWRLVEVVSRITPVAQHFCWKRRCALWDDVLGQESWSSEDLSPYVLAGLPFLSLVVRPGGYGFPVPLVWDEKMQSFSGYNAMNQKWDDKDDKDDEEYYEEEPVHQWYARQVSAGNDRFDVSAYGSMQAHCGWVDPSAPAYPSGPVADKDPAGYKSEPVVDPKAEEHKHEAPATSYKSGPVVAKDPPKEAPKAEAPKEVPAYNSAPVKETY